MVLFSDISCRSSIDGPLWSLEHVPLHPPAPLPPYPLTPYGNRAARCHKLPFCRAQISSFDADKRGSRTTASKLPVMLNRKPIQVRWMGFVRLTVQSQTRCHCGTPFKVAVMISPSRKPLSTSASCGAGGL